MVGTRLRLLALEGLPASCNSRRPACPAFLAGREARREARARCSAAQVAFKDGHREAAEAAHAAQFAAAAAAQRLQQDALEAASYKSRDSPAADGAARMPVAALQTLLARVHQGCRLLLDADQPEQCLNLLRAGAFLILDQPLPDEQLARQLLLALIERCNTERALSALPLLAPSPRLYGAALRAFAARGSVRGVREVARTAGLQKLLQGPESRELWLELVGAYGRLRQPEEARSAFRAMRRQGAWTPADTRGANVLLHALHEDAFKAFVRYRQFMAEGVQPDASTFNILLKGCMRSRDARRAELAFSWMREAGVAGDEFTFNTLIKVFSYAGQLERVLGVRALMAEQGFEPTPRIWGSLLVACGAARHLEQALVLWAELKARHKQLVAAQAAAEQAAQAAATCDPGSGSNGSEPGGGEVDAAGQGERQGASPVAQQEQQRQHPQQPQQGLLTTEVFNAMMTACIEGYQGERALTVFEELRGVPGLAPDLRSFNLAIKGCESPPTRSLRPQQLATAMALAQEMEARGLQPDVFTYGTLIELCARAKQGATALRLHDEMLARGVKPNKTVISSLFKALGASGMVEECMAIFRRIVWGPARVRPNEATFRHLLQALKGNGALGHALRVYQGMREVGYPPRRQEFTELISAAAEHALLQRDTALQEQVLAMANVKSCREVDLHGMSSTEARAAVLCVLSLAQQQYALHTRRQRELQQQDVAANGGNGSAAEHVPQQQQQQQGVEPSSAYPWHDITIITGCGRNSAAGEAVLPKVVLRLLKEELGIQVDCTAMSSQEGDSGCTTGAGMHAAGPQEQIAAQPHQQQAAAGEDPHALAEQPQQLLQSQDVAALEGADGVRAGSNAGRIVVSKEALQQWVEGKRVRCRGEGAADPSAGKPTLAAR